MSHKIDLLYSIILIMVTFLSCGDLPSNPVDDPNKVTLSLSVKEGSKLVQKERITLLIAVNIPKQIQKFDVNFGTGDSGNVSIPYNNLSVKPDTLTTYGKFLTSGNKKITVTATLSGGLSRTADSQVTVIDTPFIVCFDSKPTVKNIFVGKEDTLKFTAFTHPSGGNISFTAQVKPALDGAHFRYIQKDSMTQVFITATDTGYYMIGCIAQSGLAFDTSTIKVKAVNKLIITKPDLNTDGKIIVPSGS